MGYRRRLVTWSITGAVRHLAMFGAVLAATLVVAGIVVVAGGSIATRLALAAADRNADREWAAVLAPLSTVPERYPPVETDERALRLEGLAASLGVRLEAGQAPPLPAVQPRSVDPARLASTVTLLLAGDPPVWAMDIAGCSGAPATSERGHRELQRLLLAAAERAIARDEPAAASSILEASWRLNESLLRSPSVETHLAACTILEQEAALLCELPYPGEQWRVRLAALDVGGLSLEAYRFEAWQARCLADRDSFAALHPALRVVGRPLARLLAHQQHEAMLFAVRELPRRDPRSFDADTFVAEQHALVPRTSPIAQASLPHDWTSWPRSVRAALSVDLALRVLELRSAAAAGREVVRPEPRQPSRIAGVDWLYEPAPGGIRITIDSAGWPAMAERPLRAVVRLRATVRPGGGA